MEKGKISSLQMAVMIYPAIVATAILGVPSITAKYAKNDLWLSPIWASVIGYVTVYIVYALHKLYPNKTIIEFSEHIVGRFAGKLLGFLYLFFLIPVTGQILRSYGEFVVDSFLVHTPISVIMASMIFLCSFVVRGGLEVLGRMAELLLPFFLIPVIIIIFLLFPDFEVNNVLPIMEDGLGPSLKGAIVPSGWFSEIFLMTFLLPFVTNIKSGRMSGIKTVFAIMMTLIIVNMAVLFVLGTTTATKVYPLMNVTRYVSLADFFEHLESVIMAAWILGVFVKLSVFYYASVLSTAQWLKLSDYRLIVWPIGILIVESGFWSFPSAMEAGRYDVVAFPFYGIFMQTIIPLLLLFIAWIRKRKREERA